MEYILLLTPKDGNQGRVKDFLHLGGCRLAEGLLEKLETCYGRLKEVDLIIMECDVVERYISVCKKLRTKTDKPIVIVANQSSEWECVKMFQAGADDYLVLPYYQTELMARIQRHIFRYKHLHGTEEIITIRELTMNSMRRTVLVRGHLANLRNKEFDVLLYLMQNMDIIISREEIYRVVWKEDFLDSYANTINVHIKRIREEIEEDITNPKYIETVWGIGYRFRSGIDKKAQTY